MDDLISRRAAIDAVISLCDDCDSGYCGSCRVNYEGEKDARKVLEDLPSAQAETDWIPVTKKAHPDKEGKYLVTDDAGGMADSTWDEFIFCDDGTPSWMYSQNVTAWKPFPEPWRGEE